MFGSKDGLKVVQKNYLKMVQICSKSVVKIGLVLLSTTCWDISAEINRKLCTPSGLELHSVNLKSK